MMTRRTTTSATVARDPRVAASSCRRSRPRGLLFQREGASREGRGVGRVRRVCMRQWRRGVVVSMTWCQLLGLMVHVATVFLHSVFIVHGSSIVHAITDSWVSTTDVVLGEFICICDGDASLPLLPLLSPSTFSRS